MTKFEKITNEETEKEAMIMLLGLPRKDKDCEVSFIHKAGEKEACTRINGYHVDTVIAIQQIVKSIAQKANCEVKEVYEYLMKTSC